MKPPIHRLFYVPWPGRGAAQALIAASGPHLRVYDAVNGTPLSQWTSSAPSIAEGPPAKRRRLSAERPDKGSTHDELERSLVAESQSAETKQSTRAVINFGAVTNLCHTRDGRQVVALTPGDKYVRVLKLDDDGILSQISQRQISKRPSAVALTPLEKGIVCADKVGDVFLLPLMEGDPDIPKVGGSHAQELLARRRRLNATELTVHTKKNLEALENQKRMEEQRAKAPQSIPEPRGMDFDHEYILSHVSLLTDIAMVALDADPPRQYLFTADRDERIRVSRGPPQTYVIEAFLQEHTEFVSRIHVPVWSRETLISAGGDSYILIWHWLSNALVQKSELLSALQNHCAKNQASAEQNGSSPASPNQLAVSGIWSAEPAAGVFDFFIVCEAVPAVFVFRGCTRKQFELAQVLEMPGNVLDLSLDGHGKMLVSFDTVHEGWTTDVPSLARDRPRVGGFRYNEQIHAWIADDADRLVQTLNDVSAAAEEDWDPAELSKAVSGVAYGLEQLRKHRSSVEEDDEAE